MNQSIAFVLPSSFVSSSVAPETSLSALNALTSLGGATTILDNTHMDDRYSNVLVTASSFTDQTSFSLLLAEGEIANTITTIASVLVIIVFGLGALTLVMANIIIPKAAEELEQKARKEYPHLWAETEAKLQEGEVLAMRPDLIQDLGRQVQQGDIAKFEALAKEKSDSESSAVNAEVITDSKEESK
jgi:hypothetical protein